MKRILVSLALGAFLLVLFGCSVNPVTGKSELNFFSRAEEKAMGDEAAPQILAELGGVYPDPQLSAYVTRVGRGVAESGRSYVKSQGREFPDWQFNFYVVNDSMINAFALPGGHVFVTRGILSQMKSEAELAGLLGHECAHVFLSHSAVQQSTQMLTQLGVMGLGMALEEDSQWIAGVAGLAANLNGLSHSRGDESASDRWGMEFMVGSRYDANGIIGVMQMLQAASSGSSQPEFLSTHPNPANRIAELTKLRDSQYANATESHGFVRGEDTFKNTALAAIDKTRDAYLLADQGDRQMETATAALQAGNNAGAQAALAQAAAHYAVAVQRQPTHGLLHRKLGQAQMLSGDNAAAINSLAKARSFQGSDFLEDYLYGAANESAGKHAAALSAYQQSLSSQATYLPALTGAARSSEASGQNEAAARYYQEVARLAPANSELANGAAAKVQALTTPAK